MMKYFNRKHLIITSLLLIFSVTVAGCTNTSNSTDEKNSPVNNIQSKEKNLTLAEAEAQSNNLKKAIFYYIQALEFDKDDIEILCKIGHIQNRLDSPELAMRAFKQALTVKSDHVPALAQMGIYYFEHKQTDKAKDALERTVKLDQQRLHTNVSFERFIALDSESPLLAYNALAVLNDLDRRHEYAREIFNLLLPISENLSLIYTNMGYSYYLTSNYALAENFYTKALDINANFERAKLNLGLIYVRTGQYNQALQLFKQVMSTAQAYNDIGYFLLLDGRYQESEYFLQNAIDLSPSYLEKSHINFENVQLYLHNAKALPSSL
ncbi:MAG: tetratricopeptide repeat protein [Colwellia sp.]|nr:tetratricopeptide repeat protein [Colwellia sp.]